ncbi:MAG: hypothetical protein ACRELB_25715, partial [Polyangiaceae bacterium]
FAQRKLRRARPALHAEPLAGAAALLGDAPLRVFAPGPFTGTWAGGFGGLLRATTAIACAVTLEARETGEPREAGEPRETSGASTARTALRVRILLCGAWGADAAAASERLGATVQLLATDSLGRLIGLDHPLEDPRVSGHPDALRLQLLLDPLVLARGIHAATDAKISEVMAY